MPIRLTIPTSPTDYTAIATLHNLARLEPVTVEELYKEEIQTTHDSYFQRMIALDEKDTIVGTSLVRPHWERCFLSISTHPDHQQQGIGAALYDNALTFVRQQSVAPLITILRDDIPSARTFAEKCGFALYQHWRYFQLDLTTFETAPFSHIISTVQAQGIRFFSLADVVNTPDNQHKHHALNARTSLDAPGEESFPTFEEFEQNVYNADWFHPDGQILAADGDRWVGLGAVGIKSDDPSIAFNAFTGVDRSHRRRHIALALTLRTIDYAIQHGATKLRVFNDSRNVGMLSMQEKLGYQPIPGRLIMTKLPFTHISREAI